MKVQTLPAWKAFPKQIIVAHIQGGLEGFVLEKFHFLHGQKLLTLPEVN